MNASWILSPQERKAIRRKRLLRLGLAAVILVGLLSYFVTIPAQRRNLPAGGDMAAERARDERPDVVAVAVAEPEVPPAPEAVDERVVVHPITNGDTLSTIFDHLGIHSVMYQILAADESLLALDVLRPGQHLTFTFDEDGSRLLSMELFIDPGKQVLYSRFDNNSFGYEEMIHPGQWQQQLLDGEINGSFYLSAIGVGLSEMETANITNLFRDHLNFARDMRAGDRFQVVRSRQFVGEKFTGQSRIEGVRILRRQREHTAFLFEDGNYYDATGESLARAFRRYPMGAQYRISSSFNPARKHPITGQVQPHNGVDFAMPTGTPILATGDGVVTRVMNHPYAGKYVEVQHGSQYLTRYLHLHRILVKRGQTVKRGERIALSGNTGRSTGPHLHFELHVHGRPVNPITAKIPMAASVPKDKRTDFKQLVEQLVAVMENGSHRIAALETSRQ
ncbi:peptidoglycan DD-metalloendopeptidase family protein [Pelovirga terrestris]|uniref:Peptidoglycan DD-metalloendopeptidase family protein n=1 Tax=Pelovirga terrestris TaxID=2771352 RepID=A0A8J6QY87_9BACT|nr:peptidoglycan DD-metalloendopeptidase family protein [Pelovirga terrestris]MBD1400647.1 peptidoglycan DD-metalloendopeptidase family protein [Pelovirga terrestris]